VKSIGYKPDVRVFSIFGVSMAIPKCMKYASKAYLAIKLLVIAVIDGKVSPVVSGYIE